MVFVIFCIKIICFFEIEYGKEKKICKMLFGKFILEILIFWWENRFVFLWYVNKMILVWC